MAGTAVVSLQCSITMMQCLRKATLKGKGYLIVSEVSVRGQMPVLREGCCEEGRAFLYWNRVARFLIAREQKKRQDSTRSRSLYQEHSCSDLTSSHALKGSATFQWCQMLAAKSLACGYRESIRPQNNFISWIHRHVPILQ